MVYSKDRWFAYNRNLRLYGTVAKTWVYYDWRRDKKVRAWIKPPVNLTSLAVYWKKIFALGMYRWRSLTAIEKKMYDDIVRSRSLPMTGKNFFLKNFLLEAKKMGIVKNVYHYTFECVDGLNTFQIAEVNTSRAQIFVNIHIYTLSGATPVACGILGASFQDATHVIVQAVKVNTTIPVYAAIDIIEYI